MTSLALIPIIAAFVWLLDRRDKRHQSDRARLLELMHDEREQMAQRVHDERVAAENARAQASPDLTALVELVDRMAQRLQAPEWAVQEHRFQTAENVQSPPAVMPDDDKAWWEAQQAISGMSAEELAQQSWDAELRAREPH